MAAKGRKESLCDFSNVVAFVHNELCRPMAAKVTNKLGRISPIGKTGVQSSYTGNSSDAAAAAAALAASIVGSGCYRGIHSIQGQGEAWLLLRQGAGRVSFSVDRL